VTRLDLPELAAGVCEGRRDDRLFRLACYLRWRGYLREQAEQIVVDAARRCRPPFPTCAALRKVDSAWRYSI
jgi:Primase C terminal 1 (PriCT-1)